MHPSSFRQRSGDTSQHFHPAIGRKHEYTSATSNGLDDPFATTSSSSSQGNGRSTQANPVALGNPSSSPLTPGALAPHSSTSRGHTSPSFRNVSACERCRKRKNRCDQELPSCRGCRTSNTPCIGIDPLLNEKFPRSYVYYLETRTVYLERLLAAHQIPVSSPLDFAAVASVDDDHPVPDRGSVHHAELAGHKRAAEELEEAGAQSSAGDNEYQIAAAEAGAVEEMSQPTDQTSSPPAALSFAYVYHAAMQSSIPRRPTDTRTTSQNHAQPETTSIDNSSMRDAVFRINSKTNITPANFPEFKRGKELVDLYFDHANPQLPILHRVEFTHMFEQCYDETAERRTDKELYLLNMVFAIGAGIITKPQEATASDDPDQHGQHASKTKRARKQSRLYQPEQYQAAAIQYDPDVLRASESSGKGLEELQAVLLLASFALLRPVAPGLWYIVGYAVRLALDLGLHHETDMDPTAANINPSHLPEFPAKADDPEFPSPPDHPQWTRDMKRRLWWTVYSLDRLASTVVGRPFSVSDQVINTEFPSLLDDKYITRGGFRPPADLEDISSYKLIARHYFRLRLLQSEIVSVLQYQSAQQTSYRVSGGDPYMHRDLPSSFLHRFDTFQEWRTDVHNRLGQWRSEAPTTAQSGVRFNVLFLELNYWHAQILLYRQSVSTPAHFMDDMRSVNDGMESTHGGDIAEYEEKEQVYFRTATAGREVLRIFEELHRHRLVNYIYLSTHHLFMAGVGFLYAIWYSKRLRKLYTIADVNATLAAADIVLEGLVARCPPAKACKKAFDRMTRVTVQMCYKRPTIGSQTSPARRQISQSRPYKPSSIPKNSAPNASGPKQANATSHPMGAPGKLAKTGFDYDLRGLLSNQPGTEIYTAQDHLLHDQHNLNPFLSSSYGFGTGSEYFGRTQLVMPLHTAESQPSAIGGTSQISSSRGTLPPRAVQQQPKSNLPDPHQQRGGNDRDIAFSLATDSGYPTQHRTPQGSPHVSQDELFAQPDDNASNPSDDMHFDHLMEFAANNPYAAYNNPIAGYSQDVGANVFGSEAYGYSDGPIPANYDFQTLAGVDFVDSWAFGATDTSGMNWMHGRSGSQ